MKTTHTIKVRGYHVDHFNHVNNARYLEFLEEARWHYCEENNLIDLFHQKGIFHVTANINITYKRSAVVGDILRIETSVEKKDRKSITMKQQIFIGNSQSIVVDAKVRNVFLTHKSRKTVAINNDFIQMWPGIVDENKDHRLGGDREK